MAASSVTYGAAPSHRAHTHAVKQQTVSQLAQQIRQARLAQERQMREQQAPITISTSGHVTLPNGKPAGGAQVYLGWVATSGEYKTLKLSADANGAFHQSVKLAPRPQGRSVAVTAFLPGQGLLWKPVALKANTLPNMELKLPSGATLTGRVLRLNGRPAAHVAVHVAVLTPTLQQNFANETEANNFQVFFNARFLPQKETEAAYQAVTDDSGRFTLKGLPRQGQAVLQMGNGLVLAPGSMSPVKLTAAENQDAGILVATQTGRFKVRVINSATGKPAAGVVVQIMPANSASFLAAQMQAQIQTPDQETMQQEFASLGTDQNGEATTANLRPGEYQILFEGRSFSARVEEGHTSAPVELALRVGPLKGRVLDTNGKPLAHLPLFLEADTTSEGTQPAGMQIALMQQQAVLFNGGNDGNERGAAAKTAADGSFTLSNFPWGCPNVALRAQRGNDMAAWTGAPSKLGATLTLRLRHDALVTVSGRLIDPQRHLITKVSFQTLHWQNTPRLIWFMRAHQAKADSEGRFELTGLERGESFSLVTGGPGGGISDPKKQFESPRFITASVGADQDLGDVMVHPSHGDDDDIPQEYGLESPGDVARNFGFVPAPSAEEVSEARQVLARYQQALAAGDVDIVQQLTSQVSTGWSENREEFLLNGSLRLASDTGPEAARALPLVPRATTAMLLKLHDGSLLSPFGGGTGNKEQDQNLDWVFLAQRQGSTINLVGILHKDDGQWRVVTVPGSQAFDGAEMSFGLSTPEFMSTRNGMQTSFKLDTASFDQPSPAMHAADLDAARQTGAQFLASWSQDHHASMLALTSPVSPIYTKDILQYRQLFSKRSDEGLCPLNASETPDLQPVTGLTLWDQDMLADSIQVSEIAEAARLGSSERFASEALTEQDDTYPAAYAKRGDIVTFQYTASGRNFLMLLVRYDGKWKVQEPALPM
jgi:protocatechuate 3,4-dioxygenase beta subunit